MRLRLHPEPIVTYVGDRNINYSNVCVCACRFCAFFRAPDQDGGYVISREEMAQKIEETLALGGTQVLLQGGHHPDLPLEWYEDLLRWMRATWLLKQSTIDGAAIREAGLSVTQAKRFFALGEHVTPCANATACATLFRPNTCA